MKEDEAEFFSSLYETATEEVENLKLTLERNELREQVLKQELTEMEQKVLLISKMQNYLKWKDKEIDQDIKIKILYIYIWTRKKSIELRRNIKKRKLMKIN